MEPLATIAMIKREMKSKRINASDLTRGLKMKHSTVVGMLKRSTLQVQRLAEISEFSGKLRCKEPDSRMESEMTEVNEMKTRIRDLEKEVSILRQTIRDLAIR